MKRWLVIIVVAILLAVGVVAEEFYVNKTISTLISSIELLKTSLQQKENIDDEQTLELSTYIKDYWLKREKIICLSYNHKDMEKIGEQVTKVHTYVLQNNKDDCEYELDVLKFYVEGYKDVITTNFQNVL